MKQTAFLIELFLKGCKEMGKYILVTAEKFGYGPIITCLNIVKVLKRKLDKKTKLIFLGTSIAKEQAISSKLFDEVIECKTYNYHDLSNFKELFIHACAIVSSENQFGAIYAKQLNAKNVYFIDNLVWMWDKITPGLEIVDGYFISETFSSKENFKKIGQNIKNPIFVGPLRDIDKTHYGSENMLMINFGGAESFMLEEQIVKRFYKKILSEILNTVVLNKFDKIFVCGGSGIINAIMENCSLYENVEIKTLPYKEYLDKLHKCSHIIMSSGLGNFIETVGIGKSIMYIPPVNYSQLLQLEEYKNLDLGFEILNWDAFDFYKKIPEFLDEEAGVNMVVENVAKYLKDNSKTLYNKVIHFIDSNKQTNFFSKRNSYISNFSSDAPEIIANYILKGVNNENTK